MPRLTVARPFVAPLAAGISAVAAVLAFALVLDDVRDREHLARWDPDVLRWVVDHRTEFLTELARLTTWLGSGWVVTVLAAVVVVFLAATHKWALAGFLVAATAGTAFLVQVVKELVGRHRPPLVERLVDAGGAAFPSGHAAQAIACFGALAFVAWRLRTRRPVLGGGLTVVAVIVFGVGWSRVYLGVHWPSDVLGGWLLGATALLAAVGVFLAWERHTH
jgi:membrane-associated phospholipid phosphatase